jgi:YD repeat-containing protein
MEETDENGKKRLTFTDKMGRVVLVRQQIPATLSGFVDDDWANTYTAYDDFGRVAAVMPPEASRKMKTNGNWDYTNSTHASMIYRYAYDARGRMTSKTIPSGGASSIAYDRLDRPVLTTDANGFKVFARYDKLNRPIVTGRYKGAAAPSSSCSSRPPSPSTPKNPATPSAAAKAKTSGRYWPCPTAASCSRAARPPTTAT